ncbi:hypothetical protein B8W69_15005 [Mycobacterium vulneris]|uniref:Polyketide cyclase n=1 Tax=Mycolicibacterium vulneris TaxID=547163 RepID=A0A1X2KZF1_9MYCO|nr:hypothetical protein [Mycolicibacterium vulneris]OSC26987.1 hypothetical protein B8W69_15005 [Mycolicibacterium vulneris]
MGIVSTTSETAFTQSAETVYDFVTNPRNWTKTYPGQLFLQANPAKIDAYHEAVARELARSAD